MADRKIVLAVDDMPENLTLMRSILQDFFDIRLAKSGKMALDLLENLKVDLILLDIEMPGISGFEFLKRVKADDSLNKKTPVIFVTAHAGLDYIHDAISAGAKDYVLKPVNAEALYKKIDAVVGMPDYRISSTEGNLRSLKTALAAGDSVRADTLFKELANLVNDQNVHQRQYAEDIGSLVLCFEYDKAIKKVEAFLDYLARSKKS